VRELENMIERAVVFCRTERIEARDLPLAASATPVAGSTLGDLERNAIERALATHAGNVSRAAAELGLSRAALYRRIEKYGL
jgi:transcriptional regulator of acetoin/glycerol metabolism